MSSRLTIKLKCALLRTGWLVLRVAAGRRTMRNSYVIINYGEARQARLQIDYKVGSETFHVGLRQVGGATVVGVTLLSIYMEFNFFLANDRAAECALPVWTEVPISEDCFEENSFVYVLQRVHAVLEAINPHHFPRGGNWPNPTDLAMGFSELIAQAIRQKQVADDEIVAWIKENTLWSALLW
jgi:hypothetical protein